ncbi:MAG: hypothetical protein HQL23_01890 [Candidatus Omnitrophica bacterium]|nr:hypothetical protein [Candidatus Omnitrophota bacterium]
MTDKKFFGFSDLAFFSMALASFAGCAGMIIYGAFHLIWLRVFFSQSTYYFILGLTLVWAVTLIKASQEAGFDPKKFWQLHKTGILFSLLAASFIFISVPKYFRVLSDETNLLSVARTMTFEKRVDNVTEGRWYYERFWPTASSMEKRCFLFPFFTQLFHVAFGYHVYNVFILNFFALWGLLFAVYLLLSPYISSGWSLIALVCVLAQPVITLSATSASYEVFNSLFIALVFLSLRWFLSSGTPVALQVLCLNLFMLANIRYESIIFLAVIIFFLFLSGYLNKKLIVSSPILVLGPVFLFPWLAQRVVMAHEADSNLIGNSWMNAFQFDFIANNVKLFFNFILNWTGNLGYAGILNWLGLAIFFVLLGQLWFNPNFKIDKEKKFYSQVILLSLLFLFIAVLAYQGGINDHPLNGRFYLPILIFFSVLPAISLGAGWLGNKLSIRQGWLIAAALFIFYHPIAMRDHLANDLVIIREDRLVREFLNKNADQNALIICGRPGQLTVDLRGAISFSTANREKREILDQYHNHLFSMIYVIQTFNYQTRGPLSDNVVDSIYALEPVTELQTGGGQYMRISKVRAPGV